MTITDIADYMKLLFQALAHIHRNFTIHRDIKPSNFMFCPRSPEGELAKGMLVDFGLAQNTLETNVNKDIANIWRKADSRSGEYAKVMRNIRASSEEWTTIFQKDVRPNMKAQRAGTRGFRAPEVLLKVFKQDFAIDIWSAGVILLTLLTRRYSLFVTDLGIHFSNPWMTMMRLLRLHACLEAIRSKSWQRNWDGCLIVIYHRYRRSMWAGVT